jgi:hypothetical protein
LHQALQVKQELLGAQDRRKAAAAAAELLACHLRTVQTLLHQLLLPLQQ